MNDELQKAKESILKAMEGLTLDDPAEVKRWMSFWLGMCMGSLHKMERNNKPDTNSITLQ